MRPPAAMRFSAARVTRNVPDDVDLDHAPEHG